MEIPTRSPSLDTGAYMFRTALVGTSYADNFWFQISGKQATMSLSLRLLHLLHHIIPCRICRSFSCLGASVCRAS